MQELYKSGKYYFAFAIIAFGFIQLNVQDFMSGFLPVSKTLPGRTIFLYITSILFIIGGICMCIKKIMGRAALYVGILFLVLLFYPHLASLLADLHNPAPWTSSAEDLAISGGAFIIAGVTLPSSERNHSTSIGKTGKIFFALSLIVFAVQHFMYADFIATLIPAWIPFKVFWAYFVGVAFVASSLSILTNIKTRTACILLGFMYLFWVIFLHLPRVAADTHAEAEKTSMFIAFAFAGIFFTLASQHSEKSGILKN